MQSGPLLLQFVSKRHGWPLAKAGYLLSIQALVAVVVLGGIIPAVSRLMRTRGRWHPLRVNVSIGRLSLVMLAVGNFVIGLSANSQMLIAGACSELPRWPLRWQPKLETRRHWKIADSSYLQSAGLVVSSAGAAFPQAMQSILASLAKDSGIASLYGGVALIELISTSIGSPAMAALFDMGVRLDARFNIGGYYLGIPFWSSAVRFPFVFLLERVL